MTKKEILAAAGYPNTPDGIAAFYNEYDTPEKFFAKHGGSLSGAPHNGQPTADQFFDYGSHANDKLNIPMSNPFFLKEGGAYYGGPTRPYKKGGLTKYQKKGEVVNPWQIPGATNPDNPNFIHSTTPGTTRWLTKEGKTPFQELLSKPKTYGSGEWTAQDTLIQNDPRLFNIEKTLKAKPEYKQAYWGSPIMRDLDEAERAEAYMLTYGDLRSLINQTGTAKGSNPDPYDQMYYNAIQGNESGNAKPVSSDLEKKLRFYSKAKKYGGDITEFCWGGGLPGGPNEMPEMLHGGYHSPMNYGSFPATEWGGALDASNQNAFPMMEKGGLKQFLKSVSKAKKKAYKEGGKTTIQGGNQNFLESRRASFDDALKNNVYNAFIQEEEKAAMQAMNPYATGMEDQDMEYQARKGKQKEADDVPIDFKKGLQDLFPSGRDYSAYIPGDIKSGYYMSNADYARMAHLNKRIADKTFNLTGFKGTAEYGPMARLLGKTGRRFFGPKAVTYEFTGRGSKQVPIKDTELNLPGFKDKYDKPEAPWIGYHGAWQDANQNTLPDYLEKNTSFFEGAKSDIPRADNEPSPMSDRQQKVLDYMNKSLTPSRKSDENIQKQSALPTDDNSLMESAKGYYSPFAEFFTPSEYGPGYADENVQLDPSKLRTSTDTATARKMQQLIKNKKYGGGLGKYQMAGQVTPEQYYELEKMYKAAQAANVANPGKMSEATGAFQQRYHELYPERAQEIIQSRGQATAKGKSLAPGQQFSLESNVDKYFGPTTEKYWQSVQQPPGAMAQPGSVTGTYPQLQDMNVPDTGMNLNFKAPTSTPNLAASTKPSTLGTGAGLQDMNEPDTGIAGNLNLASTQGVKPTKDQILAKKAGMDMKPLEKGKPELTGPTDTEVGPEEKLGAKIKRKTKGIGKTIAKYAPGAADWISSNLEQKPDIDPMQNQPIVLGDPGDYDINSGEFRLRSKVPVQFPGGIGAYRTKFGGALPQALSGLEVKMQPGLYGTNGNRQFTLPTQVDSQKFSQQPVSVRGSLTAVPRDQANLEAEGGETALVNIDGIPAHFKISGKRHSQGGVPLDLPDNSFIYSDTASMKIKDPNILAQFGMAPKKGGYTPAEIAKKYDINKYRKILSDPNSEALERKTAEAMIANNNMKLAKLAMAQESIKGFPQGIPVVAMPYMMTNNIDPSMYIPTQGQEEQPDEDMGVQRYGGNIVAQYPTMRYGGLPKAQKGNQPPTEDAAWVDSEGNWYDEEGNPIQADNNYFGLAGVGDFFKNIARKWSGDTYEFAPPPKSGVGEVDRPSAKKAKEILSKLNPANVEWNEGMGLVEYPANILNLPLSGVNAIMTGKPGTTGNFYTDVAFDPTTYIGGAMIKAPVLATRELAVLAGKYGPVVGRFIQKYGKKGYEIIEKYGAAGVDAIKKYGKKGIDYVVEKAPIVAKKVGEALAKPPASVYTNIASRGATGFAQEQEKSEKYKKLELQNQLLKEQLEQTKQSPDALVVRPSKPKETPKINVNAELAKKLSIAQAKKAEAEYAQAMQNMNRFTGYTNIPQEERLASLRTLGQQMIPAATPMVAPSALVVEPAAPAVQNVEVKKKPAAKTSNTDWENVDWSKYEVKKK